VQAAWLSTSRILDFFDLAARASLSQHQRSVPLLAFKHENCME